MLSCPIDGRINVLRAQTIARLGYYDYISVDTLFQTIIPVSEKLQAGLEGSPAKAARRSD